jgi:hypothetical protein
LQTWRPLLAEHLQHALRHGKAAEHVDRDEPDADDGETDDPRGRPAAGVGLERRDLEPARRW